jgi:uncharacterized protein (DUF1800 family)
MRHRAVPLIVALSIALTGLTGLTGRIAADVRTDEQAIVHVLNRLGFGPRPGDVEAIRSIGLERYIEEQLHPERIDDSSMGQRLERLETVGMSARELVQTYGRPLLAARRQRQATAAPGPQPEMPAEPAQPNRSLQQLAATPILEASEQKLLRAMYSDRQLEEVLVDFWFNHFNVDSRKGPVRFMVTEYEREAIRPHVLGRFRDLLGATAKSPAMLFYLDNWMSAAPQPARAQDSPAAGRRRAFARPAPPRAAPPRGLNENYARELMELHTLGVDGGYTQQDVTEVARVFTGWTIDRPRLGGGFTFEARLHDNGEKIVLGRRIAPSGIREGEQVLDMLARHPSTALFIATKLARRFVGDDPPASLIARAASRFRDTDGDLREVLRTIFTSREFLEPTSHRAKTKTPFEFVVSAARAINADIADARPVARALQALGMPLYQCQPPTGYKDSAEAWTNAGALLGRMNFALALANRAGPPSGAFSIDVLLGPDASETTRATVGKASNSGQALALALGSPEFQKR